MWPADRNFDVPERSLFELFLETFAGDPATNLYKLFIDSRTRQSDLGAQSVAAGSRPNHTKRGKCRLDSPETVRRFDGTKDWELTLHRFRPVRPDGQSNVS